MESSLNRDTVVPNVELFLCRNLRQMGAQSKSYAGNEVAERSGCGALSSRHVATFIGDECEWPHTRLARNRHLSVSAD
jgi:hypothetical protein